MSTFSALNTALTALYAQRRGLDVTGQNIANANTDGYSRQRADMTTVGAPAVPAMWSTYQGTGSGVSVASIDRIRNQFLESRGHTEHAKSGELTTTQSIYGNIETAFNEPTDTGIQQQLSDFWAGWSDVANTPDDASARAAVVEKGKTLADTLNATHANLFAQWQSLDEQVHATADDVNSTTASVAELNQAIVRANKAGLSSNELADQRDLLVMKLAGTIGATVKAGQDGGLDVYVGGTAIVHGASAEQISVAKGSASSLDIAQTGTKVSLTWGTDGTGYPVSIESGSLKGMLDGMSALLPTAANKLDDFAAGLADAVNQFQTAGYSADGIASYAPPPAALPARAGAFFTPNDGSITVTAANISVAVTERGVAISSLPDQYDGAPARQLSGIGDGTTVVTNGLGSPVDSPDLVYRKMVTSLGVQVQTVNNRVKVQQTVTDQVDAARDSEAGVNIDEEMTNMLAYQHAYEAASRVLTTVDETLDTLINRTGLVGR